MKKTFVGVVLASAFAFAACGTDKSDGSSSTNVCDRYDSYIKGLPSKVSACPDVQALMALMPAFDVSACKTAIASCTADDVASLTASIDCQEKVGTCAAGKDNEWLAAMQACPGGTVSAACTVKP